MTDKTPWFAQKRYGYGAGLPIAWQGWALLGGFAATLAFAGWLNTLPGGAPKVTAFALVIVSSAVLMAVTKARTQGGWRWRWGGD